MIFIVSFHWNSGVKIKQNVIQNQIMDLRICLGDFLDYLRDEVLF